MSQEDLQKKCGLSQSALSDLERGKSARTTSLAMIANALGVSALWLETGRGPGGPIEDPRERDLVEVFSVLGERDKEILLEVARSLKGNAERAPSR